VVIGEAGGMADAGFDVMTLEPEEFEEWSSEAAPSI
jgi:hypothetical protein